MAHVRPFRAWYYNQDKAGSSEALCCPPYDIIPDASVWRDKSPYNMIRLEKPEGEDPYRAAADTLRCWREQGVLLRAPAPSFYLYELIYNDGGQRRSVSGIFADVQLSDYDKGEVLPHENTLSKAKADRYELMMATRCHFSPIYCLYRDPKHTVLAITGEYKASTPAIELTDPEGTVHRLWVIDSPLACTAIAESFIGRSLYIADGHHRYETSLKVARELGAEATGFGMMMLVDADHPGLLVYPTHRMVAGVQGYSTAGTLHKLAERFTVEPGDAPGRNTVVMLTAEGPYRLVFKEEGYDGLDVTLLHDYILQPVFGIDAANMAAGTNLTYTRDASEAAEAVKNGSQQCAFIINPTRVDQILTVADAGGRMPQKSTYFYPKLITGLVINDFSTKNG